MSTTIVGLALSVPSGSTLAQDVRGWPHVAPEMVRQIDSLTASAWSTSSDLVVDMDSFDRVAATHGWPPTTPETWGLRLGDNVDLELPRRVATETCRVTCPYEGEPRIYRLTELTRTLPHGISRELGELSEGHLLAVVRFEFNIGVSEDPQWRSGYREYFFVLDAEAESGPRIASRVNLVKLATGGPR